MTNVTKRARGLAALIPTAPSTAMEPGSELPGAESQVVAPGPVAGLELITVDLDSVVPNSRQPRTEFDPDALAELARSLKDVGFLQPIVVRRVDSGARRGAAEYELVAGERRWRAARVAGLDSVPAIVRSTDDDALLRDALLENLQRVALNPLEEAAAYEQLLADFGGTHDELAQRLGRSRPQVSNTMRLLKLPTPVQRRVAAGVLSAGHARALLSLPDASQMEQLAKRVVAEGISVRGLEEIVSVGPQAGSRLRRQRAASREMPELGAIADRLSDLLDTRVAVTMGRSKGKISIDFAGIEDLHRIVILVGDLNPNSDLESLVSRRRGNDAPPS